MIDEFDVSHLIWAARAAKESVDTSTQCGACFVTYGYGKTKFPSYGPYLDCNSPTSGFESLVAVDREYKSAFMEHAERKAIYSAARRGHSTGNGCLYATWAACPDCARAIILSGITRVVTFQSTYDLTPERWKKQIDLGIEMMKASGIQIDYYQDKLPNPVTILFDGKELTL